MTAGPAPAGSRRHLVVALCFLAVFVCYLDRVNLSVAALALQEEYGWSNTTKGAVLASFFAGYLATQVPAGLLAARIGGRLLLGVAVLWWSACTLLTPWAAAHSVGSLIAMRIALGAGEGAAFPAIFAVFRGIVPREERSRAVSLTLSAAHVGTLTALVSAGWIITRWGWPMMFYLFGSLGFIWAAAWFATRPPAGLAPTAESNGRPAVPWRRLLGEPSIRALMASHFCVNWTMYLMVAWLPSYFRAVHGISIQGSALLSAAPYACAFLGAALGGSVADALIRRGVDTTRVRKLMQTLGLGGAALALLATRAVDSVPDAVAALCVAMAALSLTFAGTAAAILEVAPRYAEVVSGMSNTVATIPGIVAVFVAGWLLDLTGSYDAVLLLTAAVSVCGAIVWAWWGRAEDVLAVEST